MKKRGVLFALMMALACLGGCQAASDYTDEASSRIEESSELDSPESDVVRQPEQESPVEKEGFTLEEILKDLSYVPKQIYIVRDKRYIPTLASRCELAAGYSEEFAIWPILEKEGAGVPSSAEAPVLRLSEGDELITTSNEEQYYAYEVLKEGYFLRNIEGRGILEKYDEVDGVDISDKEDQRQAISEILANKGIECISDVWVSDAPVDIVVGKYQGTAFAETVLSLDAPYCMTKNKEGNWNKDYEPVVLKTEKTKEGYFTVDTSGLSSGTYLIGQTYLSRNHVMCKIVVS